MFKTDKESLEKLSFSFDEKAIANLRAVLEYLNTNDLLTISKEEAQEALKGVDAIGKLKLDGKIYAFHVEDSYADYQSGCGEGVELYLRQGDKLDCFYVPSSRDLVYSVDRAAKFLKEHKKSTIYTGVIPLESGFLGLPHECDEDDPIIRDVLKDYEINEFESKGIEVVMLDSLM